MIDKVKISEERYNALTLKEKLVYSYLSIRERDCNAITSWARIARENGLTEAEVIVQLTLLELKGFIQQYPGKRWSIKARIAR